LLKQVNILEIINLKKKYSKKFLELQKKLKNYWGFPLYDKGEMYKSGYCVMNTLQTKNTEWIYHRTLKEIEEVYFKNE